VFLFRPTDVEGPIDIRG